MWNSKQWFLSRARRSRAVCCEVSRNFIDSVHQSCVVSSNLVYLPERVIQSLWELKDESTSLWLCWWLCEEYPFLLPPEKHGHLIKSPPESIHFGAIYEMKILVNRHYTSNLLTNPLTNTFSPFRRYTLVMFLNHGL